MKLLASYHEFVNRSFTSYGAAIAHRPFIPMIFGIIILGFFCIGLKNAHKEANIEVLWVEQNSRLLSEKEFFDSHFGGLPRKESVTVNVKSSLDNALPNYGEAMDALTDAIKPLYNITHSFQIDGNTVELTQADVCERPFAPTTLAKGPAQRHNYLAWGYRNVSKCILDTLDALQLFPDFKRSLYDLPADWGIDRFPCYKVTPMDCFKEGKNVDYPEELEQLEQFVAFNHTKAPLSLLIYFLESQFLNFLCVNNLQSTLNDSGLYTTEEIDQIVKDIKVALPTFASWGYNWRRSYKEMTSPEILDYFNGALKFAKDTRASLQDPLVAHCLLEKKPCCLAWFGGPIPVESTFGSITKDTSGNITKIGAIRWGANNFNQNHPLWIEHLSKKFGQTLTPKAREALVVGFEGLMIDRMLPLRIGKPGTNFGAGEKYENLQLQFNMWRSSEDFLNDANKVPVWQIFLSAALVALYSFWAFVDFRNPVHSHATLVLTGLVVVGFSVVSGFGLTAAAGIKFSPLAASVVPFLAIGLGVDDIFVLVTMLQSFLKDKTIQSLSSSALPEHEMSLTAALAGPSLVLTTFSVIGSFFISSISPMPLVRWFCWQMGITSSLHTIGMLLIFFPLMALDAKRAKSKVVDPSLWTCCGLQSKQAENTSNTTIIQNGGGPSIQAVGASTTTISKLIAKFYAPLFSSNVFKVIVAIVFAAFLGSMTYLGFWKVEHGLKLSDITVKGSYQYDFAVVTQDRFPTYDYLIVTRDNIDYPRFQQQFIELFDSAQKNLSYWNPSQPKVRDYSWLANFYLAMKQTNNLSYPIPEKDFYILLKQWTRSLIGAFSLQDLYCYDTSTEEQTSCLAQPNATHWSVKGSKVTLIAENLGGDTEPNLDMIRATRRFADNINAEYFNGSKSIYVYGVPYLLYEQYLHSNRNLYTVVGFALVGVFLAVLFFQFSITTSVIIVAVLLMVDIEVYGFLYVIGAKLNSLSLVNLGIVVGMASEFTYLSRCFLVIDGTKDYRVGKALEWTFEPLLHGFGTQVAATLPLLLLKYPSYKLYYFGMFTTMGIVGFLNGFVLLPVLLSWFGPPTLPHATAARGAEGELVRAPKSSSDDAPYERSPAPLLRAQK
ncbi:hypothetical protein KP509_03G041600 [Ceratopteris richardii]|uniref:SSD domain-containing protein n=1 Tax=Ceratopteris richardii TaxID=49495 RepID=A0A8T2UZB5_CERRI|nr:hypothetical protein KP509_03G041600 [Ceratopteris richardii]KAH7441527.1 hypothetical protein KP509_03G041600 [Ceratopteris richardii]